MRRKRHLFDFLIQMEKEQQAMIIQNMSLYKKWFNFDVFNKDELKKNKEITICKTENNINTSYNISDIFDENEIENNNFSQVEFYIKVVKGKKIRRNGPEWSKNSSWRLLINKLE